MLSSKIMEPCVALNLTKIDDYYDSINITQESKPPQDKNNSNEETSFSNDGASAQNSNVLSDVNLQSSSGSATRDEASGSVPAIPRERIITQVRTSSSQPQDTDSMILRTQRSTVATPSINIPSDNPSDKNRTVRKNLTVMYSSIYAVFLVVFGGAVYINNQGIDKRFVSQIFSIVICLIGLVWLIFFHFDLYRYKSKIAKKMIEINDNDACSSPVMSYEQSPFTLDCTDEPRYKFLTGRHSGSFYLKAGLAAFCFGHLINEGLLLGQEILFFTEREKYSKNCGQISAVVVHSLRPLYSFYQLFIVFKYSNIVIKKYKELARFALMHLVATCLCFWFGAIVRDAHEDYQHKITKIELEKVSANTNLNTLIYLSDVKNNTSTLGGTCLINAFLSISSLQAIPYLYPFTVEFNLLLAGVWFIVWLNIGRDHERANPHHFQHKVSNEYGNEEVTYQSNLVISADCHASNKGLFFGLFFLLTAIVTVIVFFVAMSSEEHVRMGLVIHTSQEVALVATALGAVILAYPQLSKLDLNMHPITFLDDVLLFVPLPFYFAHTILTVSAEIQVKSVTRIVISVLMAVQTIIQTPFISDGLRRCSNSRALRYEKPGREIVTFLIIANLTMWIVSTFEAKSIDNHYGQAKWYGEFLWMFISHTTHPLMLFYRFHSSVCLADIWKSAYAKGE